MDVLVDRGSSAARGLLLGAATALVLCACSGSGHRIDTVVPRGNDSPAPAPTASTVKTPRTVVAPADAVVTARYLEFNKVVNESGATSNADDPRLPAFATGAVLKTLRAKLAVRRQAGSHLYGSAVPHVQNVDVSGTSAIVRDCLDNSQTGLMDKAGRKLSVGRARQATMATLVRESGVWKVGAISTIAGGGTC